MTNPHIDNDIRQIRSRIESIERMQQVMLRAQEDVILGNFWKRIAKDKVIGDLYLLIDGKRTQQEIAELLHVNGINAGGEPGVSKRIDFLRTNSLIELVDHSRLGKVYRLSDLDHILHISRKLKRMKNSQ